MANDTRDSIEQLIAALEEKGAAEGDRAMFLRAILRRIEVTLTTTAKLVARVRKAV